MNATLVDSHCHLDRLDLTAHQGDLQTALRVAHANSVSHFLCVSIDLENYPQVLAAAETFPNVFASVGVHPNERKSKEPTVAELVKLAQHPKVVAIGETGLDYFRSEGDLEWQRDRFRVHIEAARQSGKPLIIHMRDATEDTLRILKDARADQIGGVMHCFTENYDVACQAMDLNFYISFSGIVTFKTAQALQDAARRIPLQRMLVETDSPYLAPVPLRGKPNEPAYVRHVANFIAQLRNISVDDVATATTQNFFNLFRTATP